MGQRISKTTTQASLTALVILGNSITLYNSDGSFFFVSLLLIPAAIVVFLLVAERKLAGHPITKINLSPSQYKDKN
jgi:hypothetical protein